MKRRLGLAMLFGIALVVVVLLVGAALPPESRAVQVLESIFFDPGGFITDRIGIGAHDGPTYTIVLLVDVVLYAGIGVGLVAAWDAIRTRKRTGRK